MALWRRDERDVSGSVYHSDQGSQYTSIRDTERLAKTELVTRRGP